MNIGRATIVDSHLYCWLESRRREKIKQGENKYIYLLEASRYCSVFRMSTGIADCFVGLVILDDDDAAADVMGLVSGARIVFLDGTFLVSTALRLALPVVVDGIVFAGILCISVFPSRLRLIPLAIVSRLKTLSSPGRVITPWEGGKKNLLRSQFEDSNVGFPVEVINADQIRLKKLINRSFGVGCLCKRPYPLRIFHVLLYFDFDFFMPHFI
jgi:hypothetical protein